MYSSRSVTSCNPTPITASLLMPVLFPQSTLTEDEITAWNLRCVERTQKALSEVEVKAERSVRSASAPNSPDANFSRFVNAALKKLTPDVKKYIGKDPEELSDMIRLTSELGRTSDILHGKVLPQFGDKQAELETMQMRLVLRDGLDMLAWRAASAGIDEEKLENMDGKMKEELKEQMKQEEVLQRLSELIRLREDWLLMRTRVESSVLFRIATLYERNLLRNIVKLDTLYNVALSLTDFCNFIIPKVEDDARDMAEDLAAKVKKDDKERNEQEGPINITGFYSTPSHSETRTGAENYGWLWLSPVAGNSGNGEYTPIIGNENRLPEVRNGGFESMQTDFERSYTGLSYYIAAFMFGHADRSTWGNAPTIDIGELDQHFAHPYHASPEKIWKYLTNGIHHQVGVNDLYNELLGTGSTPFLTEITRLLADGHARLFRHFGPTEVGSIIGEYLATAFSVIGVYSSPLLPSSQSLIVYITCAATLGRVLGCLFTLKNQTRTNVVTTLLGCITLFVYLINNIVYPLLKWWGVQTFGDLAIYGELAQNITIAIMAIQSLLIISSTEWQQKHAIQNVAAVANAVEAVGAPFGQDALRNRMPRVLAPLTPPKPYDPEKTQELLTALQNVNKARRQAVIDTLELTKVDGITDIFFSLRRELTPIIVNGTTGVLRSKGVLHNTHAVNSLTHTNGETPTNLKPEWVNQLFSIYALSMYQSAHPGVLPEEIVGPSDKEYGPYVQNATLLLRDFLFGNPGLEQKDLQEKAIQMMNSVTDHTPLLETAPGDIGATDFSKEFSSLISAEPVDVEFDELTLQEAFWCVRQAGTGTSDCSFGKEGEKIDDLILRHGIGISASLMTVNPGLFGDPFDAPAFGRLAKLRLELFITKLEASQIAEADKPAKNVNTAKEYRQVAEMNQAMALRPSEMFPHLFICGHNSVSYAYKSFGENFHEYVRQGSASAQLTVFARALKLVSMDLLLHTAFPVNIVAVMIGNALGMDLGINILITPLFITLMKRTIRHLLPESVGKSLLHLVRAVCTAIISVTAYPLLNIVRLQQAMFPYVGAGVGFIASVVFGIVSVFMRNPPTQSAAEYASASGATYFAWLALYTAIVYAGYEGFGAKGLVSPNLQKASAWSSLVGVATWLGGLYFGAPVPPPRVNTNTLYQADYPSIDQDEEEGEDNSWAQSFLPPVLTDFPPLSSVLVARLNATYKYRTEKEVSSIPHPFSLQTYMLYRNV